MSARRSQRRGRLQPMGPVVGRVLADLGLDAAERAFRIGQRWAELVGEETASHCRPIAVRAGVLEAEVDSSVWCQQIQLRRPEILEALRRELGDDAPSDLRLRVGYTRRS